MSLCDFTNEEIGALREVLASYVPDLRLEVGATDNKELREVMKQKEKILNKIMAKLEKLEQAEEVA